MAHLAQKIVPLLEELFAASPDDGTVFSERQLSEQLGVSRPVVREALSGLRERGLVEILPGKGVRPLRDLHKPTVSAVQNFIERSEMSRNDVHVARKLLEPEIAARAALNRSDEQLAALAIELQAMNDNLDDIAKFELADFKFHIELAQACGNALFLIWLQPITGYLLNTASRLSTLGEVRVRALSAHKLIYEAVRDKNADAARIAMVAHLDDYTRDSLKAIALGILPRESDT